MSKYKYSWQEIAKEASKIMKAFNRSYINQYMELILVEKTNSFIRLDDIASVNELRMKVLVVVIRDCCKSQPYVYSSINYGFQRDCLMMLNKALDTDFSRKDAEIIYQEIGNFVNRGLAIEFVENNYDMSLLKNKRSVKDEF